ncbi:hypothetical protein Tasa_048_126 [Tanticharoenia sakaeratensis NBRC 103193]|uniref:Uncharacterized protein n=1 Tax=Tanticharoenia sakaeratensis NBRC 103193 TaxID=1231623 RepID=A0A0D6MPX8_9PROT|nr:hypothetical protein Tasa_048_126 [Tanticharoenia sakaeratensis NBRC 103193]
MLETGPCAGLFFIGTVWDQAGQAAMTETVRQRTRERDAIYPDISGETCAIKLVANFTF